MDTIFTLGDEDEPNIKLNLDELYERKKISDLNTLKIYNKILNRIHNKIKHLVLLVALVLALTNRRFVGNKNSCEN